MRTFRTVVWIVVVFFLLVFIIQNIRVLDQRVEVQFNLYLIKLSTGPIPIYLLILISFLIGFLGAASHSLFRRIKIRGETKRLKKALQAKEGELNSLRNLPVFQSGDTFGLEKEGGPQG
jgi:putative membrane protein